MFCARRGQQVAEGEARGLLRAAVAAFLQARGSATGRDLAVIYGGAGGESRLQAVLQVIYGWPHHFNSVPCAQTTMHRAAHLFRSVGRFVQALLQVLRGSGSPDGLHSVHYAQCPGSSSTPPASEPNVSPKDST